MRRRRSRAVGSEVVHARRGGARHQQSRQHANLVRDGVGARMTSSKAPSTRNHVLSLPRTLAKRHRCRIGQHGTAGALNGVRERRVEQNLVVLPPFMRELAVIGSGPTTGLTMTHRRRPGAWWCTLVEVGRECGERPLREPAGGATPSPRPPLWNGNATCEPHRIESKQRRAHPRRGLGVLGAAQQRTAQRGRTSRRRAVRCGRHARRRRDRAPRRPGRLPLLV